MAQEKKAKVDSASATEVTQAPARGETVEAAQNSENDGVKAVVNPALGVTAVAISNEDGSVTAYEVGVAHTLDKNLLELQDASGVNYFVKEDN